MTLVHLYANELPGADTTKLLDLYANVQATHTTGAGGRPYHPQRGGVAGPGTIPFPGGGLLALDHVYIYIYFINVGSAEFG